MSNEMVDGFVETIQELEAENAKLKLRIGDVSGSFNINFIEWIGKYKMRKERISGVEKWYSGFAYWKFDNVEDMYKFYCENYR